MHRAANQPATEPGFAIHPPVAVGEYLCTDRQLYRVEQLHPERVLIEDCHTGVLIDVPVGDLRLLRRVRTG